MPRTLDYAEARFRAGVLQEESRFMRRIRLRLQSRFLWTFTSDEER
jgi:hypothetical protein